MVQVGRGTVLAHRGARAIGGVEPIVALDAQAAERTQVERGEIAMMRRVVIGDARWRDAPSFHAEPAQWLDHELMRSAALPACGAIPAMDFRTVRHRGQGLPVFYIFQAERAQCVKTKRVWSAAHRESLVLRGIKNHRARSSFVAVVTLAGKNRLCLNAPRKRLLVTLSGKKRCDINKRLDSERFRATPRTCGCFRGILSLR